MAANGTTGTSMSMPEGVCMNLLPWEFTVTSSTSSLACTKESLKAEFMKSSTIGILVLGITPPFSQLRMVLMSTPNMSARFC